MAKSNTDSKPRRDKDGRLTPEAQEEAIKAGRSVQVRDQDGARRVVTRLDDLPHRQGKAGAAGSKAGDTKSADGKGAGSK